MERRNNAVAERQFNLVSLETLKFEHEPWSLENYRKIGGYESWQKVLRGELSRDAIIDTVKASGLRGRGGAGFPTGVKMSFMPHTAPMQKYLVCNSDESEPGTCHDRDILRYNPHALVEGLALEAYAIGASVAYNYIRGEFMAEPIPRFEAALEEAYAAGFSAGTSKARTSTWTSTRSSARVRISAARRRRCSSRSRASPASRASSRRSRRTSASTASRRRSTTRRA
jgi:NADH:ubiquinone oxidoreductase subunit F (NADH-binding)